MATMTASFDACVLYPAPLRDLLMRLATTDLFRARWSAAIHDEWTNTVLATRPELKVQLARTRKLIDAHAMDALVTGYEPLIGTLHLPDPDDRHVLAAAITARADLIVTKNLKDFPAARLAPFGIRTRRVRPKPSGSSRARDDCCSCASSGEPPRSFEVRRRVFGYAVGSGTAGHSLCPSTPSRPHLKSCGNVTRMLGASPTQVEERSFDPRPREGATSRRQ